MIYFLFWLVLAVAFVFGINALYFFIWFISDNGWRSKGSQRCPP
jgi:hypothetical protein